MDYMKESREWRQICHKTIKKSEEILISDKVDYGKRQLSVVKRNTI
jgi:hypothetical protein